MSQCLYNYSAGPAAIPQEVHQQIAEELHNSPASVSLLELGHRTPEFCRIAEQAEHDLRSLLNIPDDYAVLFLAGGASAQYAMVPMNFSAGELPMEYVDSGHWSKLAIKQAQHYGTVHVIPALIQDETQSIALKDPAQWLRASNACYCHYVDNETLTGIEFPQNFMPTDCLLGCDMTSNFLSREIDWVPYGVVYAGAQKNMGIAGVTVVVVRQDQLKKNKHIKPAWENYQIQIEAESRYNTPPIFSWYICGLVLAWTLRQGGVPEMKKRCRQRAQLLYQAIDESALYQNAVAPEFRSRNNIHFFMADPELEGRFVEQSLQAGLYGLRGHRAVGGIRASLYNAMTLAGVETLVSFMREFERKA